MKNRMISLLLLLVTFGSQAVAETVVEQHAMDNGLNILLTESHHIPMVVMNLSLPAGSRFDAKDKGGSAALLSGLLMDHTAKHDYQAWATQLDASAIRMGSSVDKDTMTISLTMLKEAVSEGMQAMAEAMLQPGWNQKRFDFLKKNAISAATKAEEEADTHAEQVVSELLFPNHPYGHPVGGDIASLKRITLEDLKSLYAKQLLPQGSTLAVSGDITMKEVVALLDRYFTSWKGKPELALEQLASPIPSSRMSEHVVLDKHQTLVQWVRLGPSRYDEDFFAALVLNHMLGGGGFGSRLMEEVREKRGLVYGVYSWFQPLQVEGEYIIRLQTRADQAKEAEAVLWDVLQELADGKITQVQLEKSKENLMGGFAQRMDSNRERAGLLAMMGVYHRPLDYLKNWTKRIESVNVADVRRLAKRFLQPDEWKRVLVGPNVKD